ncbi:MAG: GAF domain-containing protein [Anaerolineales bacterium]|nr:GAF domain-containing protein [Anaerolineales bacterium]
MIDNHKNGLPVIYENLIGYPVKVLVMHTSTRIIKYCLTLTRGSLILFLFFIHSWNIQYYGGGIRGHKSENPIPVEIPLNLIPPGPDGELLDSNLAGMFQTTTADESGELPGKQIRFENISIEHGLSQSSVSSIIQDSKGFIWFGTEDGLNKFDGYGFTVYRHEPENSLSISDNSVISLYEDVNKVLWIGTNGRGLNRFNRDKEEFRHYRHNPEDPSSLAFDTVTSISNDAEGNLWIGTANGLDKFDPGSQSFSHYVHNPDDLSSLSHNSIGAIYLDQDGTLWVGTLGGGLNRYEPSSDSFIRYQFDVDDSNQISSDYVSAISEDNSGNLWIGTRTGGLNFFDKQSEKFFRYLYDSNAIDPLAQNSITSVDSDLEGNIWIGTNGKGVWILDPSTGKYQELVHDPGDPGTLSSDVITEIFIDPSGNIWVGTIGAGVDRYDPITARFTHYRHNSSNPDSLAANNVKSLAEDEEGNLWIGFFDGGIDYFDRVAGAMIHYQHNPEDPFSISSNEILSTHIDQNGDVWIGTKGAGLNRFSPLTKRFTRFWHDAFNLESLSSDSVNVIFEDRDGLLWIGTNGGGLDRFDPITGKFFHYKNNPDDPTTLSNNNIWAITEDRAGNLWLGTGGGGISVLDQSSGSFSQIQHDPADPSTLGDTDILTIFEDEFGSIWIGTFGSGLDKYEPESGDFSHYRVNDGLPNNVVHGILKDQEGKLWLSTNLGISQFDPESETFKNFDASDVQSNEFNLGANLIDHNGMMFFGGINGLSAFYPEEITNTTYMPPIIFTGLMQDGDDIFEDQSIEDLDEVILNWTNNNLEFEFVALNFTHSEKSQYAYMLAGFDDDWNYVGASRNGRYTNLPAGTYNLQVKATNSDGVWNEDGASLDIIVVPPFWETWWFIGLITIVIMGSVISGYRLRIRSIESRSQELENQVKSRTEEIERRRLEMESLYQADEIIDQNLTQEGRLRALVDVSIDLLEADNSSILKWNDNLKQFEVIASRGFDTPEVQNLSIRENDKVIWDAARSGKLLVINDLEEDIKEDRNTSGVIEFLYSQGIHSSIFLPIKFSNEIFGLFNVNYYGRHSIGEEQIRVFKALTQHSALSIQNAQLFEQLRELAINDERSRLARDLHDSAKQKAFAALAQLGAAGSMLDRDLDASKEHLLEAEDLVYEVLQELIILIQEMYPVALQEKGLANSVREYVVEWENQWEIEVDLDIQNEIGLHLEIEKSLYRVIQESLANIARHSQSRNASVNLIYQEQSIQIQIQDDGIGFDVDDHPTGLGLRSMRERIDLIHGEFHIDSQQGKGTLINVTAPIAIK